jgi:predicted TPR repeat methyltransferase
MATHAIKPDALAQAHHLHAAGKLPAAAALYRHVLAAEPNHADAIHSLGLIAWQTGDPRGAAEQIERAIALDPSDATFHNHLGLAYHALGRVAEAERAYRRAIELDPKLALAHSNLAVLRRDQMQHADAEALLRTAIALDPGNANFHVNLGEALLRQGRPQDAAGAYGAAIKVKADCAEAYFGLAQLWAKTGNLKGALFAVDCYLRFDPSDRHGGRALRATLDAATAVPEQHSDEYVRNVFDAYAVRFDEHLLGELGYRGHELVAAALQEQPRRAPPWDVLDLGCGTGLAGERLRPVARRLVGVDLSPNMIERARDKRVYDELHVGEVTAFMQQAEAAFDAIVAADVLVYIGNLDPVFAAARRTLRAGGRFAFSAEDAEGAAGYVVKPTRRYGHAAQYLQDCAARQGMAVALLRAVSTRSDLGAPIPGHVMVLERAGDRA